MENDPFVLLYVNSVLVKVNSLPIVRRRELSPNVSDAVGSASFFGGLGFLRRKSGRIGGIQAQIRPTAASTAVQVKTPTMSHDGSAPASSFLVDVILKIDATQANRPTRKFMMTPIFLADFRFVCRSMAMGSTKRIKSATEFRIVTTSSASFRLGLQIPSARGTRSMSNRSQK